MDIEQQTAEHIVNVEYHSVPRHDHQRTGVTLLRQRHYAAAARELARAVEDDPDDDDAHYYLALALLDGVRPNRRPRRVVDRVRRHLLTAAALPEARLLRVLVDEDYGLLWRYYTTIPQALVDLVALIDHERGAEILAHVPARGTRTVHVLERAVSPR
jgi:hypothetical protein